MEVLIQLYECLEDIVMVVLKFNNPWLPVTPVIIVEYIFIVCLCLRKKYVNTKGKKKSVTLQLPHKLELSATSQTGNTGAFQLLPEKNTTLLLP